MDHGGQWETSVLGVYYFNTEMCWKGTENFKCHYPTHHAKNYNNFEGQLRAEKIRELLAGLKKQQFIFSHS